MELIKNDKDSPLPAGPYHGVVVHGLQNGKSLGFPTANIQLSQDPNLEKGAYAVWVYVAGKRHGGMLYVGTRPTLDLADLTFEINLFDFTGDLYGQTVSFVIVRKIRDEQRFASLDALSRQLVKDQSLAKKILKEKKSIFAKS